MTDRFLLYVANRWNTGGFDTEAIAGTYPTAALAEAALGPVEQYDIHGFGCALAQVVDLEERPVVAQWGSTHPGQGAGPGRPYTMADSMWEREEP